MTATATVAAGSPAGNPIMIAETTNPTAEQFAAMVAKEKTALTAAADNLDLAKQSALDERHAEIYEALLAARPPDPAVMAMQLRWLIDERETGSSEADDPIISHIADQLERLAGARS